MTIGRYCQLCGQAKRASEIMAEIHGVTLNVDCLMAQVDRERPASADELQVLVKYCRQCGSELDPESRDHCPKCQAPATAQAAANDLARAGSHAPLPSRIAAFALDLVPVAGLAFAGAQGLEILSRMFTGPDSPAPASWELGMISATAMYMIYHTLFVAALGRTPGKMALGLKVALKDGGGKIGFFRALLRSGLYFLTIYVFPLGVVLLMLYEPRAEWGRIVEEDALFHNPLTDTVVVRAGR